MADQKPTSNPKDLVSEDALFHHFISDVREYAIFLMDIEGHISSWNKGAEHIKGYSHDEIIGTHYRILFPEDKQAENQPEKELEYAITHGRFENETWRRRKSGELFWANVVLTAINDKDGNVTGLIKITRDLTERKQAEDALRKHNEKLLKVNADLDNFVYTASHDLKSPVQNIAGLINTLEGETDPDRINMLRDYLRRSVDKLRETIDDLGNIARQQQDIENGSKEIVDLKNLIEDFKYSIPAKMQEDNPEIETDLQVKKIMFSRLNLKSILFNLLSNSIKYQSAERDCQIRVSTYTEEDNFVLEVGDNGIGMRKGFQEKIFKMFIRLHTHVEGTGVGLFILKRIVDNANGTIQIDSEEGKGTCFRIYLPKSEVLPELKKS